MRLVRCCGEEALRVLFGHNTDVSVNGKSYHVQTEDRGTGRAVIDTTVYCGGMVVHRRTNSYGDLLPLDAQSEEMLKRRLDKQHQLILNELRGGKLKISDPPRTVAGGGPRMDASEPRTVALELLNSKTWLSAGRASLHVAVRDKSSGAAIAGARVIARLEGAEKSTEFSTATGADGRAQLAFDMPRLAGAEPALVIEARYGESQGHLRFQLRAKPRTPAAR
jgi:hypothetical protein